MTVGSNSLSSGLIFRSGPLIPAAYKTAAGPAAIRNEPAQLVDPRDILASRETDRVLRRDVPIERLVRHLDEIVRRNGAQRGLAQRNRTITADVKGNFSMCRGIPAIRPEWRLLTNFLSLYKRSPSLNRQVHQFVCEGE
jgi:hypothetical protein